MDLLQDCCFLFNNEINTPRDCTLAKESYLDQRNREENTLEGGIGSISEGPQGH